MPCSRFPLDGYALRRASDEYPEKMVNYAMMVAIDEMSSRLCMLDFLTRVGQVIATRIEVKKAVLSFKFDEFGVELHSTVSEAVYSPTSIISLV